MYKIEELLVLPRPLNKDEIIFITESIKLSVSQVVDMLGISTRDYSRWEKGRFTISPSSETRFRLEAVKLLIGVIQSLELGRQVLELHHNGFPAAK